MIKKYRKLPVEIEAVCWTGDNAQEIIDFCEGNCGVVMDQGVCVHLEIRTLEGAHKATINDMIIKGVEGEFYPCKNGIFWQTYEEAK